MAETALEQAPETEETPSPEPTDQQQELMDLLKEQNQLLRDHIRWQTRWSMRILQGIMFGFGSFLGATLVVSLAVYMLKPLTNVDFISDVVERVLQDLDRAGIRDPLPLPGSEPSDQNTNGDTET